MIERPRRTSPRIRMHMSNASSGVDKKLRRAQLENGRYACSRCPPHDGENRRRRPRSDRYKSVRKGRS